MRTMLRSRGCKGLQPSRSIRAPGGRRSLGAGNPNADNVALPRLQGTAALQVNSGPWRAPVPRRREPDADNVALPRLQGTSALQVNSGPWRRRSLGARNPDADNVAFPR